MALFSFPGDVAHIEAAVKACGATKRGASVVDHAVRVGEVRDCRPLARLARLVASASNASDANGAADVLAHADRQVAVLETACFAAHSMLQSARDALAPKAPAKDAKKGA